MRDGMKSDGIVVINDDLEETLILTVGRLNTGSSSSASSSQPRWRLEYFEIGIALSVHKTVCSQQIVTP